MKASIVILYLLAIGLLVFGGWGRFTEAGRLEFDEMAGMIPLFCYWIGIALGVLATVLLMLVLVRGGTGSAGME